MINFKILKKSKESRARLGFLETSHGVVETPCLVPVATQGVVKTLTSEEVVETGSQILISNAFYLHLKPGEKVLEKAGGIHKFMNWKKPIMTDSGGFQVFSLGFGRDFNIGKIIKSGSSSQILFTSPNFTNQNLGRQEGKTWEDKIKEGVQPQKIKITQDGVYFQSPRDGAKLFLGPKESIKIQEKIGADIIFSFDECTSPLASYEYTKKSLLKTHNWAKMCINVKKTNQALFGIVQGGRYQDLRKESVKFISALPFDGFGIGGEFGSNKNEISEMLEWVVDELPEKKPRHLLGIGYLEDIEMLVKSGIDLFDCTVPTHYARRGIAFTSGGKLDLKQSKFLKKHESLDKECVCKVCLNYKKDYISHLLRAKELTAFKLLTFHNLCYFNNFVEDIKVKIKKGEI